MWRHNPAAEKHRAHSAEGTSARVSRRPSLLVVVTLGLAWSCLLVQSAQAQRVALLVESGAIYDQAARGFEVGFANASQLRKIYLVEDRSRQQAQLEALLRDSPDLLVAIGTQAARTARNRLPNVPLLYCLALRPVENKLVGKNVSGIAFDIEVSRQFENIQKALPQLQRIGVVYNDLTSGALVWQAEQNLKPGVQMVRRIARTPQEAAREIEDLLGSVLSTSDAFWLLLDPVVANRRNFERLVQLSLEYKVPLIAPAKPFVEAGALISVGADYRKAGEQAGRMARQVLNQEMRPADWDVQRPQELTVTVNAAVARKLGIDFPQDLRREVLAPP